MVGNSELFKNSKIGEKVQTSKYEFVTVPTQELAPCQFCIFHSQKKYDLSGCPKINKYPLCFAVEREDGESVKFIRMITNTATNYGTGFKL